MSDPIADLCGICCACGEAVCKCCANAPVCSGCNSERCICLNVCCGNCGNTCCTCNAGLCASEPAPLTVDGLCLPTVDPTRSADCGESIIIGGHNAGTRAAKAADAVCGNPTRLACGCVGGACGCMAGIVNKLARACGGTGDCAPGFSASETNSHKKALTDWSAGVVCIPDAVSGGNGVSDSAANYSSLLICCVDTCCVDWIARRLAYCICCSAEVVTCGFGGAKPMMDNCGRQNSHYNNVGSSGHFKPAPNAQPSMGGNSYQQRPNNGYS